MASAISPTEWRGEASGAALRWAIADGYIPGESTGAGPAMTSHETASILNAGDGDAQVRITLFFSDRDPVGAAEHSLVRVGG